jgi:hypothetical protein
MGRILSHEVTGNGIVVPGTEKNKLKYEQMISGPGFVITSSSNGTITRFV